ncbi:MAG: DNA adenine methylase [Campylobacterales bacterium]|nr:DNA adenine methylase [Campylobacterales bacterium]
MHYIGSKERLLDFLQTQITLHVSKPLKQCRMCDLFAGAGSVSRHFAPQVAQLQCNDIEYYSYLINHAYLATASLQDYPEQLDALGGLKGHEGWITQHYTAQGGRLYFNDENARRIDAIRQEIETWMRSGRIDTQRYRLLLATLIVAASAVANTTSVFSAFLKTLKKSAQKPLVLQPLEITPQRASPHLIHNADANTLLPKLQGEILYLDPPYNLRQYGANYHLLESIAHYVPFTPQGKTGLGAYHSSAYSRRKDAFSALSNLLHQAHFEYIFLSYSSDGIINNDAIAHLMRRIGTYHQATIPHKRFNAKNATAASHRTTEFLHILHKPYM